MRISSVHSSWLNINKLYPLGCVALIGWMLCHCTACYSSKESPSLGFYYWKTQFQLSQSEQLYLKNAKITKLYLKYADVGIDPQSGTVEPYTTLTFVDTTGTGSMELIPCFFFVNEVFIKLAPEETAALADSLCLLLHSYNFPFQEVQLDCDWTPKSRASYFAFLRELHYRMPEVQLSATIRLHQYKSPATTGIPPVNRGALMCYNTGELEDVHETNSILSPKAFSRYLVPNNYPLPLDPILPIFSWALVFRSDQFWKIIPEPEVKTLHDPLYFRPAGNWYEVQQPLFFGGHLLQSGDRLRLEGSSIPQLRQVMPWIKNTWTQESKVLSFYHLNPNTVTDFPPDSLRSLLTEIVPWEIK